MNQPALTNQRISLNLDDFQKLVRGEMIQQGDQQIALKDIGYGQMFDALVDALKSEPGINIESPAAFTLQDDEEEVRRWIHGINQGEPTHPGGFLEAFAATVCRATADNYPLLRPALLGLKAKFPQYRFSGDL